MQASPAGQWTATRIAAERSDHDPCSPFFASRAEQLVRGIGQKIPLYHQLSNFRMQLIDFSGTHLFRRSTTACEGRCHILYRRAFPSSNLGRVDTILLGQFCQRRFLTDRFKRNAGFELG
jgi:hypothetical protein